MPDVPERKLSYGELLDKMRTLHKTRVRQKEQKKALRPRKSRARTEYTYDDVVKHIERMWLYPILSKTVGLRR